MIWYDRIKKTNDVRRRHHFCLFPMRLNDRQVSWLSWVTIEERRIEGREFGFWYQMTLNPGRTGEAYIPGGYKEPRLFVGMDPGKSGSDSCFVTVHAKGGGGSGSDTKGPWRHDALDNMLHAMEKTNKAKVDSVYAYTPTISFGRHPIQKNPIDKPRVSIDADVLEAHPGLKVNVDGTGRYIQASLTLSPEGTKPVDLAFTLRKAPEPAKPAAPKKKAKARAKAKR